MAMFALEDALIKEMSQRIPIGQVLILFGAGGAIFFWTGMLIRNEPVLSGMKSRLMKIRMLFEIIGRLFYFLAVALTPLSNTTAILQATPIVVVLGAALFFGESVPPARWIAILAGFIGVVIVLQPTAESFTLLSVLAVIGLIGFAGRDLASRAAPRSLSTLALGFYGYLAIVLAGTALSYYYGSTFISITPNESVLLAAAILFGIIAYTALMKAMRTGDVSTVTPFRYSRLIFGVGLGYTAFGESIDGATLIGSTIIVGSGLFIIWHSRYRRFTAG